MATKNISTLKDFFNVSGTITSRESQLKLSHGQYECFKPNRWWNSNISYYI